MNVIDKALILKQSPLFESLTLDLLLPIAEVMEERTLQYGEKVFRYGDVTPFHAYLITSGQVELRGGEGGLLSVLKEGEFFGEEAIISNQPRGYEATCMLPTTLLSLSKAQLSQIFSDCPSVTLTLLSSYAKAHPYRKRLG